MLGKILIVEDEANIRELIKFNLIKEGYNIIEAEDGLTALELVRKEKPDLIVLDLMLPGMVGMELCRSLKNKRELSSVAIIMLTAKSEEIDKIIGLEMGADDYLTKPFSPRELTARVKAVLRRGAKDNQAGGELVVGTLRFNLISYEAFIGREKMELTPKEYELLKLFASNIGKAFTREELLEKVWGYEYYGDTRTVDVHVRHLRIKMGNSPELCDAIETVRGVGYKFRNH